MKLIKKLFIYTLPFFLVACSSANVNGVSSDLYKDGEKLIQQLHNEVESADEIKMNDKITTQIDKFDAKYDLEDDLSEKDSDYLYSVMDTYISYMEYSLEQDPNDLEKFYDNIETLKTEYDIKL